MQVFIENEANKKIKNIFNEKTLEFKKSVEVSSPYPFPYGFVLRTTSGDSDNLDCFVLTAAPLTCGQTVNVNPIGLIEMFEDNELDHKVLAQLDGEEWVLDDLIKKKLVDFLKSVFSHLPEKRMEIGDFLDANAANDLIEKTTDRF